MSCEYIGICGGCTFRDLNYEEQIAYKENKVKDTLSKFFDLDTEFQSIVKSPLIYGYRNKMEFSFGDDKKDGPLNLGMHQKKSFYNILNADKCDLISDDMKEIVSKTLMFFRDKGISYYHKRKFTGYLRNLILRKSYYENKILVNLVTSSENNDKQLLCEYLDFIKSDNISGILHTVNNQTSDAVKCDSIECLYGIDYLTEKACDIYFKISPFSFFQTNTYCAEKLYNKAKEFALSDTNNKDKVLYDLFCGTGTIAQIMANDFKKVIGVEIVAEAIEKAKDNALINKITNVEFICADVNKFVGVKHREPDYSGGEQCSALFSKCEPNVLIIDPPREGIIEKTLYKILSMKPQRIVYISCKLQSLERDTELIVQDGYKLKKICPVDMFPWTDNVETVALFEL